jgi:ankyrin repeat protein
MLLAWVGTAIASVLVLAIVLWRCHECQKRYEAAGIVRAIEAQDESEFLMLLVNVSEFDCIRDWFGESALILAVKSAGSDQNEFARGAVRFLVSRGASINEPGTDWKTPLMHAASAGNWNLCATLLAHGADASACDMFGRSAADLAQREGYYRIASLLRTIKT